MSTTDPIADLLTRIRNAYRAGKENVIIPHSRTKMAILQVMKDRKFIHDFREDRENRFPEIVVDLSDAHRNITLRRVSKPGQRIYVRNKKLKKVHGGLGVAILSTPKGIMSGEEATKQKIGGEIICEVY